ncbi:FadR family transcriptional regulator [Corynebacterium testudinoris]|uniref:Transcriptional regulator n=1 Tax=Corynebacterium testudinoris TaxID=136857 RepID=A0A0G3HEH9_9CORY|nr:FCD domain-containing protein [Corynebacterium testudinoris]AKK09582.1 transcriptional regulator [Corynebacterium testudinoris]MBX8996174.1 FadR family transcriptional regulator [Corynebacterium testudinoris]
MPEAQRTPAAPLVEIILNELGREIISGILPPGKTFTLQDIGDRFSISRTVAREAMRALEQLGLVSSSRRVGITVRPSAHWAVFDQAVINWRLESPTQRRAQLLSLNELRTGIEPQASRLAAAAASSQQRTELVELATTMRELSRSGRAASQSFLDVDLRFHALLMEASGNEMFAALIPPLLCVLEARSRYDHISAMPGDRAIATHEDLAAAVASGDRVAAENYSRSLLSDTEHAER